MQHFSKKMNSTALGEEWAADSISADDSGDDWAGV
jgi:hypothetical protein